MRRAQPGAAARPFPRLYLSVSNRGRPRHVTLSHGTREGALEKRRRSRGGSAAAGAGGPVRPQVPLKQLIRLLGRRPPLARAVAHLHLDPPGVRGVQVELRRCAACSRRASTGTRCHDVTLHVMSISEQLFGWRDPDSPRPPAGVAATSTRRQPARVPLSRRLPRLDRARASPSHRQHRPRPSSRPLRTDERLRPAFAMIGGLWGVLTDRADRAGTVRPGNPNRSGFRSTVRTGLARTAASLHAPRSTSTIRTTWRMIAPARTSLSSTLRRVSADASCAITSS